MPYSTEQDKADEAKYGRNCRELRYTPDEWAEMVKSVITNEWKASEFKTYEGSEPDAFGFRYPDEPLIMIRYEEGGKQVQWWTETYTGVLRSIIDYNGGVAMGHPCDVDAITIEVLKRNPPAQITM